MKNIYVEKMKSVVTRYYQTALTCQSEINDTKARYNAKFQQQAIEPIVARSENAFIKAKQDIAAIFEETRYLLCKANFPSVAELTEDKELFEPNAPFELTAPEIESFITKYEDNFSMQRVIRSYLDRRSKKYPELNCIKTHSAEEVLTTYKKFADSALSLIESIHSDPNAVSVLTVRAYADEQFGRRLYEIVGDGSELESFRMKQIPETAKTVFDSYKLNV